MGYDPAPVPSGPVWSQRVVALGGGHGLYASLSALRHVVSRPTAVVTVADNGGSSGRLRGEFGVLPPGDLRMALAALCGDNDWGQTWAQVLQHRFTGSGEMGGHVTGNLLIVSLWELLGDPVTALDWVGRLLGAEGRVLPMANSPMDIVAEVRGADADAPHDVTEVRGQVAVATTAGRVVSIRLEPAEPEPCHETLAAVHDADWVLLGPGSWYTSVLPHLMVHDLREALAATAGKVIVVLNLAPDGETTGKGPVDLLDAVREHAPDLRVHTVLADPASVEDADALEACVRGLGARLHLADLAVGDGTPRHDRDKLARAYARIIASG